MSAVVVEDAIFAVLVSDMNVMPLPLEEYVDLLDKIEDIPREIVNDFMDWAIENLNEYFDGYPRNLMEDVGDYESQINHENVKTALISFMMYSLRNPDEYLDDFKITGWNGFELYGSGSGRQLLSIIHGCDFKTICM